MKSALGMCLNWRVIVALAALAVGIFVLAPGYAFAALPLLFLAVCPLSMGLMMFVLMRMGGHGHDGAITGCQSESPEALRQRLAALREEEREVERQLSGGAAVPSVEPGVQAQGRPEAVS